MSWHAAQSFCKSEPAYSSHLVEIFNQEQQDYMVMKAFEAESLTGSEREWWFGSLMVEIRLILELCLPGSITDGPMKLLLLNIVVEHIQFVNFLFDYFLD